MEALCRLIDHAVRQVRPDGNKKQAPECSGASSKLGIAGVLGRGAQCPRSARQSSRML